MPSESDHPVIRENESLKPFTTFKVGGPARYFVEAPNTAMIREGLDFQRGRRLRLFVLGGGSNILVSDRGFDGFVLHLSSSGIEVAAEDEETATLRVRAGETWDRVVAFAVEHGWWGIENLSHIPGQAGAALVQNIGAYGQQVGDVFRRAEVLEVSTGESAILEAEDCRMAYRSSIFNTAERGRYIILTVELRLAKQGKPNLSYPDLKTYFAQHGPTPALAEIRKAIISIRDRKFPFPREERGGNAGSFFKNFQLSQVEYEALEANFARHFGRQEQARLREIREKFRGGERIKIPAAFLIDVCGLKGYRHGGAQVNPTQPLVLMNLGGATARDVLGLAGHVRRTVYARTGLTLALEPELVGFEPSEIEQLLSVA